MTKTVQYTNAFDFLKDSQSFLIQNEIENNLILGICYNLIKNNEQIEEAAFANIFENDTVVASSINTIPKTIIVGSRNNDRAIKELANYYKINNIDLKDIIGRTDITNSFISHFNKSVIKKQKRLIYSLEKVENVALSTGEFQIAKLEDQFFLNKMVNEFYNETKVANKKNIDQLIKNKKLFTWKAGGEIVTIAAIIRETENAGIIGMVYTPKKFRNKGLATSCVKKISELILKNKFKYCGLFTDASNPTSNKIYINIGYKLISEFQDVIFEEKHYL